MNWWDRQVQKGKHIKIIASQLLHIVLSSRLSLEATSAQDRFTGGFLAQRPDITMWYKARHTWSIGNAVSGVMQVVCQMPENPSRPSSYCQCNNRMEFLTCELNISNHQSPWDRCTWGKEICSIFNTEKQYWKSNSAGFVFMEFTMQNTWPINFVWVSTITAILHLYTVYTRV